MAHPVFDSKGAFPSALSATPPSDRQHQHMQRQHRAGKETGNTHLPSISNHTTGNPTAPHSPHAHSLTTQLASPNPHSEPVQAPFPQLDGPQDLGPRGPPRAMPAPMPRTHGSLANPHHQPSRSAYRDLLPYCTSETPLSEQQVVGLSDVAGSLKEVMLLALRAKTDERCARELAAAVGMDGVRGIVDFFENEFEI